MRPKVPLGRAKTIPLMGRQPKLIAGVIERPAETPSPTRRTQEPFSFPTARELMPETTYDSTVPRPVVEAEIDELMAWGMARFLHRYPRCTPESVKPLLIMATRGIRMRFLRTATACALFVAETTPWEPLLAVYEVFVVSKPSRAGIGAGTGGGGGRDVPIQDEGAAPASYRGVKLEVPNLYKAGKKWAEDIGAVTYQYGESTGVDLDPIAEEMGHDVRATRYTLILNKPAVSQPATEAA